MAGVKNFPVWNQTLLIEQKNYPLQAYPPVLSMYRGDLDPDLLNSINSYWRQLDPPTAWTHYAYGTLQMIIMMFGIAGNSLVIYMAFRCPSLRTVSNILLINLAISDWIMMTKLPIAVYNSFTLGPTLGDIGCRIYGFIGGLSGTASILTLTAISIDRYNAILHPLNSNQSRRKFRVFLNIVFIWIISFVMAIIPAMNIGLSRYVPEGFLTTCSFDYLNKSPKARIFMFVFFVIAWLIPIIVIIFCYVNVVIVVVESNKIPSTQVNNKIEVKLALIIASIIGLWFLAWTPYAIVALFGILGWSELLTPFVSVVPGVFCKISACLNPYLYSITHPRFKTELKILMGMQQAVQPLNHH